MHKTTALLFMLMAGTSGCSNPPPPEAAPEQAAGYQGREDTKTLQNADNIGYDGTGIQKKLDKALDQNDRRAADIDARIEAQSADGAEPEAE
jgi:hypothetical protein